MWKSFTDNLLINNPIVIRSSTFRRNIGLQIHHQKRRRRANQQQQTFIDYYFKKIRAEIEQMEHDRDARLLVICRFKEKTETLATRLKYECYYSDIGAIDNKTAILAC